MGAPQKTLVSGEEGIKVMSTSGLRNRLVDRVRQRFGAAGSEKRRQLMRRNEDCNRIVRVANVTLYVNSRGALLVEHESTRERQWIPKSQIDEGSDINADCEVGECGDLYIPVWLAKDRNLIYEEV